MAVKHFNRRVSPRFLVNTGTFILKDSNSIRMGPLQNISMEGFAISMAPFPDIEIEDFSRIRFSLFINDLLLDDFTHSIAYVNGKGICVEAAEKKCHLKVGIQFIDMKPANKKALESIIQKQCLSKVEDRRGFIERRTGLSRRRCDGPQYHSGYRDGRDRRHLTDRRNC